MLGCGEATAEDASDKRLSVWNWRILVIGGAVLHVPEDLRAGQEAVSGDRVCRCTAHGSRSHVFAYMCKHSSCRKPLLEGKQPCLSEDATS